MQKNNIMNTYLQLLPEPISTNNSLKPVGRFIDLLLGQPASTDGRRVWGRMKS